ncbi:MAG TPA: transcription-repair coupling factor [Phycisphaerales bacterium]|nr:transcription-repair coupling factor [Phycisphaerales bacterium]HMP36962.1 transcription-repair coupling factor [Phycisphaerales bacterium]
MTADLEWFAIIEGHPAIARLATLAEEGGSLSARGAVGSSTALVAAAVARRTGRPVLLVVAHLDDADESTDELVGLGIDALRLPALETLPGESGVALELVAERLAAARRLLSERPPAVLVAAMPALMQGVPAEETLRRILRTLRPGDRLDLRELAEWLGRAGYERRETVEQPGEFAIRGGIVDLFPPGADSAVRLDLFGDEIERIFEIDLATQASDRARESVELVGATIDALLGDEATVLPTSLLPRGSVAILAEVAEILEQGRGYFERVRDARGVAGPPRVMESIARGAHAVLDVNHFSAGANPDRSATIPVSPLPPFATDVGEAIGELATMAGAMRVVVPCETEGELQRGRELLREHAAGAAIALERCHLHRGFIFGDEGGTGGQVALVPQHELLHRYGARPRTGRLGGGRVREAFMSLEPGDYVVHRDHGIARFVGLGTLPRAASAPTTARSRKAATGAEPEEVLTLEFDGAARLHVPIARIDLVQRYVGAGTTKPTLSTIGGRRWKNQTERTREAVRDLAAELLRVQAARQATAGIRFPDDTIWQREFEAEFPWQETEDQLAAIAAMKRDMCQPRPMDRLICGDVGFGKTEVAMRAAFKAVESGRQVAVLVPTTVLAEQHEHSFAERFRAYPFKVASLSRFKTAGEQAKTLREVAAGRIDVIIGTHRLLSKDVVFKDLGLVIVDEEQRFGVEHKARLLEFRVTADVLTLSATPIPRTLHMAMLGLRDISSLTTPPLDRRAIVTEVIPFNPQRMRQALERELAREGQAFVVHNRVSDILSFADEIQRLVPDAKIVVGHGQMPQGELEKVMLRFVRREAQILVSTTIIESGIDIPTANTMIINNAHMFGLAELHQLRGRVGRSKHRAYCYLLTPTDRPVTEDAMKRLRAIEDYSMLGAGFRIAMRDLEIRGAGNLLGAEQSGHISAVGYEMYCQLLEQAVGELRDQPLRRHVDTAIEIGIAGSIPRGYIPADQRRMEAYRRIVEAEDRAALDRVEADLRSAYGDPPKQVETLLDLARLRLDATALGIRSIARAEQDIVFHTERPAELERAFAGAQGTLRAILGTGGAPRAAAGAGGRGAGGMGAGNATAGIAGAAGANGRSVGLPGSGRGGVAESGGTTEVFYRPPPAFLEPKSLMAVLRKRLARDHARA